jgi:hypothetical protein
VNSSIRSITYPLATCQRAEIALRCLPFNIKLFQEMRARGVSIFQVAGNSGVELGYTKKRLTELVAESNLVWLIQVGILRREVDGQGLTDSFRLTPLGLQLIEKWGNHDFPRPRKRDHFTNFTNRWLRSII